MNQAVHHNRHHCDHQDHHRKVNLLLLRLLIPLCSASCDHDQDHQQLDPLVHIRLRYHGLVQPALFSLFSHGLQVPQGTQFLDPRWAQWLCAKIGQHLLSRAMAQLPIPGSDSPPKMKRSKPKMPRSPRSRHVRGNRHRCCVVRQQHLLEVIQPQGVCDQRFNAVPKDHAVNGLDQLTFRRG